MLTVSDVKVKITGIIDKATGRIPTEDGKLLEITEDEIAVLIYAFESDILFDRVSDKFVAPLKSLPKVPELESVEGMSSEEIEAFNQEAESVREMRTQTVATILITAIKESILQDLKMRFGA